MQSFLIGLQFLTRIHIVQQTVWTEEDFGRSVKFFPLVGAVLGAIYGGTAWILCCLAPSYGLDMPEHLVNAILVTLPVLCTGALHCDGLMDTVDGVFSGRSRERMLEIMKDSCSGAFGVISFVLFILLQYAAISDLPAEQLPVALFVMPIISRMMMVMAITLFPYARKEGMGKSFTNSSKGNTLLVAFVSGLLFVLPWGWSAALAVLYAMVFTALFGCYVSRILGGLTGDVYGAVTTLCELVVIIAFIFGTYLFERGII
ncbi:MAG: adenosylcobinamide-GDP ribazoletransferase [Anaerovibrio sp.]|uniref:adenosylcobinamide-GDP ribazoletransferase n=1 Tax=Anaerovibrio sp. TaxID=1872532 RepID=UPI0025E6E08A|nr:adenosylcobinamide-GDP ribazoletransferase [Anaerovibrio sp.]MCR5177246.1 adenosylcobinamide-GDP ribazoletransferase [Anaerovibrio sp.]